MVIDKAQRQLQQLFFHQLIEKQLLSPLGLMLIMGFMLFPTLVAFYFGVKGIIGLLALVVVIPMVWFTVSNLEFGMLLTILCSFFVNFLRKFSTVPFGTALDALLILLLISLLIRQLLQKDYKFATHPMSVMIYLWIAYNVLQALNPYSPSLAGWVYSVRSLAIWQIIYFVAFYSFSSLQSVYRFLILIIVLSFLSALYGLKQEYIGFTAQEMNWLYADPLRYRLFFTWSRLRIFSLFSDPTSFGMSMAYTSLLCFILATGRYTWLARILLILAAATMLLALGYTGSRTPVIMLVAGIVFYMLMTLNVKTIFIGGIIVVIGAGFMLKSTSNPVIYRLQSAFSPQEDSSMKLRLRNQAFIQPYIQSHPIGAGLGTIGLWGKRFNSNSWLATFAPDSAYVRVAVEAGWIGLIIYLMLFFVALYAAIHYYFRVKDPTIKLIYLGLASVIFLITLANYPQEAAYMLPTNLVLNVILALIVRLKDFDVNYQQPIKGN